MIVKGKIMPNESASESELTVKVRFSVVYEAVVRVEKGQTVANAVNEVDIPERPDCQYVTDTFEVEKVTDPKTGESINYAFVDDEDEDDLKDFDFSSLDDDDRNAYLWHKDENKSDG